MGKSSRSIEWFHRDNNLSSGYRARCKGCSKKALKKRELLVGGNTDRHDTVVVGDDALDQLEQLTVPALLWTTVSPPVMQVTFKDASPNGGSGAVAAGVIQVTASVALQAANGEPPLKRAAIGDGGSTAGNAGTSDGENDVMMELSTGKDDASPAFAMNLGNAPQEGLATANLTIGAGGISIVEGDGAMGGAATKNDAGGAIAMGDAASGNSGATAMGGAGGDGDASSADRCYICALGHGPLFCCDADRCPNQYHFGCVGYPKEPSDNSDCKLLCGGCLKENQVTVEQILWQEEEEGQLLQKWISEHAHEWELVRIPADGLCLFRSLCEALQRAGMLDNTYSVYNVVQSVAQGVLASLKGRGQWAGERVCLFYFFISMQSLSTLMQGRGTLYIAHSGSRSSFGPRP